MVSPVRARLRIISPCYNEMEGIRDFIAAIERLRDSMDDVDIDLLLIDDGSTDDTGVVLREAAVRHPWVQVIGLARNFGHQAAISCGLEYTEGMDAVIVLDSDLQHPPALIPTMIERWRSGDVDVVQGVRVEEDDATPFKRMSSDLFYTVYNSLSPTKVVRGASDFYLLARPAVDLLRGMPERHRFLRGMLAWSGLSRSLVPYKAPPRHRGHTKYSVAKMTGLAMDAITSTSAGPLRFVSRLGVALVFLGGLYLLYVLWVRIGARATVPGWASVIGLLLILGGAQLLSLGVFGEYLARVFDEVKGRPQYVVKYRTGRSETGGAG